MAAVGTQSPAVNTGGDRFQLYRRMSSRSAPGPILEMGLEDTQHGLYPCIIPGKVRSKRKKSKRMLQLDRSPKSQGLIENSLLSSLLDNTVLADKYDISSRASGLQNLSAIQEHIRVQSPPLFISTSCPCNMEYLSYSLPTRNLTNNLTAPPPSCSGEPISPSTDCNSEKANTMSHKSTKKPSPKSSMPKSSPPKFSPPISKSPKENSDDKAELTPAAKKSSEVRKKSSPKSEKSTKPKLTPKNSPNGSSDGNSGDMLKCTSVMESPKTQHALKAETKRTPGSQEQSTCRRNLLKEFEANLTFKPAMNRNSLKIAARTTRRSLSLEQRLLETNTKSRRNLMDRDYTFSPHLNPYSIKLARHRATRQHEIQARQAETAAKALAAIQVNYTFKPLVSEKSQKIAESLQTTFLRRQEMHMEKRKNVVEDSASLSASKPMFPKKHLHRSSTQTNAVATTPKKSLTTVPMEALSMPEAASSPASSAGSPTSERSLTSADPPLSSANVESPLPVSPVHMSKPRLKKTSYIKQKESKDVLVVMDKLSEGCSSKAPSQVCHSRSTGKKAAVARSTSMVLGSSKEAAIGSKKNSPSPQKKKVSNPMNPRQKASMLKNKSVVTSQLQSSSKPEVATDFGSSVSQSPPKVDPLELKDFSKLNSRDKFRRVRIVADRKIKERKVFLLKGGYRLIRRCLRKRGWVELNYHQISTNQAHAPKLSKVEEGKVTTDKGKFQRREKTSPIDDEIEEGTEDESDSDSDVDLNLGLSDEEYSDEEEYSMVCRSVRNATPNLVWTMMSEKEGAPYDKNTLMNHYPRTASLTTKVGLCNNLRNLRWYGDTDPDTFFPRCYKLACDEDKDAFIEDYRVNAAISILKIIAGAKSNSSFSSDEDLGSSSSQKLKETKTKDVHALPLVIRAVNNFLASKKHMDIEGPPEVSNSLTESEWNDVIQLHYTVHDGIDIKDNPDMLYKVKAVLKMVEEVSPQYVIDGTRNLWIVKPGALSRGRGILCLSKLEEILNLVAGSTGFIRKANRWVVQKYIEHPLLIFNTKFDIRQWFLVTSWNPLTMWMYKESYLRFSTQPFTLNSLDASIHLCNNSIQRHFTNCPTRSSKLPPHNMWDSETFSEHLNSIGAEGSWSKKIYPGMKRALIHVLLVTQDDMDDKKNCFELYGADFMIDSNLNPWIIEINSCPTMESSTDVTKRLCRQVLEDTIKVIVDKKENKDCSTGQFELAYKQPKVDAVTYVGTQLCVLGQNMPVRSRPLGLMDPEGSHHYENTVTVINGTTIPSLS